MIHPAATIPPLDGKHPRIHEIASIAPGARIVRGETIGAETRVGYNCAPRAARGLNG